MKLVVTTARGAVLGTADLGAAYYRRGGAGVLSAGLLDAATKMILGEPLPKELVAVYIGELMLKEEVTRAIVSGALPIDVFRGVTLTELTAPEAPVAAVVVSFVAGTFALYEDGTPSIRDFVAVPGKLDGMPSPAMVETAFKMLRLVSTP